MPQVSHHRTSTTASDNTLPLLDTPHRDEVRLLTVQAFACLTNPLPLGTTLVNAVAMKPCVVLINALLRGASEYGGLVACDTRSIACSVHVISRWSMP